MRASLDSGSMMRHSSPATSRPSASAWRSTVFGATARPASSRNRVLAPAKLVRAAAMPTMRSAAGERQVSSMPSARSRGLNPEWHHSQWYQARSSVSGPSAVVKTLGRRPARRASPPHSQGRCGPFSSQWSALSRWATAWPMIRNATRRASVSIAWKSSMTPSPIRGSTSASTSCVIAECRAPFFPVWPVGPRPALHRISGR